MLDVGDRLRLLEVVERGLVDGLEPEGDEIGARGLHELQQLRVADDVGTHLRPPAHLHALVDHHAQQSLEAFPVGGEVVVVEEDELRSFVLELGDDTLGAAEAVLLAEHGGHRAEGAVERAAPAGHDGRVDDALPAVDQREVGERQQVEVRAALVQGSMHRRAVFGDIGDAGDRTELAGPAERLRELHHDRLARLPTRHVVGVLQSLVDHERDVRAADDDGDAPTAQVVGDPIRLRSRGRGGGEADEVGGVHVGPVDGCQLRVEDAHVVPRLHQRRTDHRQAEAHEVGLGPEMATGRDGLDQTDLHTEPVLRRTTGVQ